MNKKSKVVIEIRLSEIQKPLKLPQQVRRQISQITKSKKKERIIRFSISPARVYALVQSFRPTNPSLKS